MLRWSGRLVLTATLMLSACRSQGPDVMKVVGQVDFDETVPTPWVVVPDTVVAGTSFEVTLLTAGGGCTLADGTQVEPSEEGFVVTPYDINLLNRDCPGYFTFLDHSVSLEAGSSDSLIVTIRAIEYHGTGVLEVPFPVVVVGP